MTLDILAALEAAPVKGESRCTLAQWFDAIPEDTPGRDELIRLIETPHTLGADTLSNKRMAAVLNQLGSPITSDNPIGYHRNGTCRCYR
jgi:hypothetical protein